MSARLRCPGLPAKPVIDIDLTVADSADEPAWLPALEAAGFELVIREPWWQEHRALRYDDPRCNLHVFSPGAPEPIRHKIFRDWLREHPEDLALYRDAKLGAATAAERCRGARDGVQRPQGAGDPRDLRPGVPGRRVAVGRPRIAACRPLARMSG